ncbi:hypothetical protein CC1G_15024 [Coprinopsis cinerea okayama7|uniref:Uncharacterized protein n=1 Tax=Coprinopsis cinerea (strain Okayama-7 / 130 / ATCC MYA-4618 / FGSC 9003) TaxID=240176 RepID=D6RPD1_COPC7|nr:hypothetical protein CC1G_15024 [Coprinopsis cinerea okayama7\|eukprot:XP_002910693.1 hypothetical protein CC1G_15024 [Coprinopsis cinerea okayama7\
MVDQVVKIQASFKYIIGGAYASGIPSRYGNWNGGSDLLSFTHSKLVLWRRKISLLPLVWGTSYPPVRDSRPGTPLVFCPMSLFTWNISHPSGCIQLPSKYPPSTSSCVGDMYTSKIEKTPLEVSWVTLSIGYELRGFRLSLIQP